MQAELILRREVLLGITGKDFTIIAASKAAMRGPTILKANDDKTRELNNHTLMAFSGEAGDTGRPMVLALFRPLADSLLVQFAEFIQANIKLYSMRNDTELGPSAVANFVRGELARSLRSRKPYNVNLLLGGMDPITKKPSLYWLDYLASLVSLPYAAHGYAQYVDSLWPVLDESRRGELIASIGTTACPSSTSTTTQTSTSRRA